MLSPSAGSKAATLRQPASEITVLEIVELLDGPLGAGSEASSSTRPTRPARSWPPTTVADMVEQEKKAAGVAMYYI